MHHKPTTPAQTGADSPRPPTPPDLAPLVARLKQTCLDWPAYGLPFAAALDRALVQLARGATYTRISPRYAIIQASPHAVRYRVSLGSCPCCAPPCWCWHRALLHAVAALPERGQS